LRREGSSPFIPTNTVMRKQHHIIYVPGISDDSYLQSTWVRLWRLYGVHGHLHEMPWLGKESFEPKFERLLSLIDQYKSEGHQVSLVGASAGASAVINAYVERKDDITGLVYVCAKILAPETVYDEIYAQNPAFKTSIYKLQDNLKKLIPADKAKMHSFYSPADTFVPHPATIIPGVRESRLPPIRHGRAVLFSVTFGAYRLLHPLKKLAK
jgi:pimeloyl-ACP methyl ester carboxylesterase